MVNSRSAWIAALLATVGVAGCAAPSGEVPQVGRAALQDDIAARLTEAGEPPRSVTCQEDLLGEVGRVARCDVVISDTNSFQPVVTVTSVDGGTVGYELTPALSQAQLEGAVTRLAADAGERVAVVACESGLEGAVGAQAHCDVDSDGVRARRTVEVTDVTGLTMNFNLLTR
jgi:hypothetical protein